MCGLCFCFIEQSLSWSMTFFQFIFFPSLLPSCWGARWRCSLAGRWCPAYHTHWQFTLWIMDTKQTWCHKLQGHPQLARNFVLFTVTTETEKSKCTGKWWISVLSERVLFLSLTQDLWISVPESTIGSINYKHGAEGFIFIWILPQGNRAISNPCPWLLGIFNYLPGSF